MAKDVPICPACGSTNLKPALLAGVGEGVTVGQGAEFGKMLCKDCGYAGICPVVAEDDLEAVRKKLS